LGTGNRWDVESEDRGEQVKRLHCWAIKIKRGGFVNVQPTNYWEADRTMLFRTQKQAKAWLASSRFWESKGTVVKVTVIVKEYSE
jgi:hypothetical protein